MKPELENLIIQWSSIPIAILICGSFSPEARMPIEALMSRGYKNLKAAGERIRRLLYNNNPPLYCL